VADAEPYANEFARLIARIKKEESLSESAIARRIGVAPATVNHWVHGKRGGGRGPKRKNIEALAEAFPSITVDEYFAAIGRSTPGTVTNEERAEVLSVFADLTADQQKLTMIQMRAVRASNFQERS
jgi:transcriptional regulator with XRE-family HTH domain